MVVVQAEVGTDGKVTYGVIFRHDIRAVLTDDVENIVQAPPPPAK